LDLLYGKFPDRLDGEPLMRDIKRPAIALIALSLAIGVPLAVTSIGGADPHNDPAPVQYADGVDAAPAPTGRSKAAVVADVLAQVRAPNLVSAAFVPPGTPVTDEPGAKTDQTSNVLSMTVDTDGSIAGSIRSTWIAQMVAGVIADQLAAEGDGPLASIRLVGKLPNGSAVDLGSGIGNVVTGQRFSNQSQNAIARQLRAKADRLGLRVLSISFVQPKQAAPALVLETTNPAAFVKSLESPDTWTALLGKHRNYEGWYLEVRDTNGSPVVISSSAHRAGVAQSWTRPDLDHPHTIFSSTP
jgi:hypothetical protein